MNLKSLAQELTEPHLTMIDGKVGKVPGLLQELREAVSGSNRSGGGGGSDSSKSKMLVDAGALELLDHIEKTVRSAYADRYGTIAPSPMTCIQQIGNSEHPTEWQEYFGKEFTQYKTDIDAYLRPKKLRRLDNIACPACEQVVYGEQRETCLYADCWADSENLLPIMEWSVSCRSCETKWKGLSEIKWLLVALA